MVEDGFFEIAFFTFIMVTIGIGLTIFEFKKMMKDEEKIKKAKSIKNSKR
jgi:hypothetical protein